MRVIKLCVWPLLSHYIHLYKYKYILLAILASVLLCRILFWSPGVQNVRGRCHVCSGRNILTYIKYIKICVQQYHIVDKPSEFKRQLHRILPVILVYFMWNNFFFFFINIQYYLHIHNTHWSIRQYPIIHSSICSSLTQ